MSAYLAGYTETPTVYPSLAPPPLPPEDVDSRPCQREGCARVFFPTIREKKRKYCSPRCQTLVRTRRASERARAARQPRCVVKKQCETCGDPFETDIPTRTYCSAKCRDIQRKRLRRQRAAASHPVDKPATERWIGN